MAELSEPHIADAAAAATRARHEFGLDADGPVTRDLLEITEQDLNIPVSILELPEGVAGAYLRKRGQGFIFIQAEHYPTRQRFTLAHELGHHILEHHTRVENNSDIGSSTKDPNEQQANYFASEFLIPESSARGWLAEHAGDGQEIPLELLIRSSDEFHVSPPAFLYRLTTCGLGREQAGPLWKAINKQEHVPIAEEMEIGHGSDAISRAYDIGDWPRLPSKLVDTAQRAHVAGYIDAQQLGRVMRTAA